jgi:hypothetical protein
MLSHIHCIYTLATEFETLPMGVLWDKLECHFAFWALGNIDNCNIPADATPNRRQ